MVEIVEKDLNNAEYEIISNGLKSFSRENGIPEDENRYITFAVYDNNEMVAGIKSHIYEDWFYVSDLWVDENYRHNGLGSELLKKAETKAKKDGIENAYIWTASFEAPDFYKKQGYTIIAELDNKPKGHKKIMLGKKL